MIKTIYFDMDGTLVDFYGVPGWLESLQAMDVRPYAEAKPLLNFSILARYLNKLQKIGYKIGIISWGSKTADDDFLARIKETKIKYLRRHLPSVTWDEISILPYGQPKSQAGTGYLFDDEEKNRDEWMNAGTTYVAYEPNEILNILRLLALRVPLN